jgi:hypothetical protein
MPTDKISFESAREIYEVFGVNVNNAQKINRVYSDSRRDARKQLYNAGVSVSDIAMLEHHLFGLKPDHSRIWHSVNGEMIKRIKPIRKHP